jgi:phosphoglucosamine mutase
VHARYIEFAKRTLPRALDLEGMRVVVDCANGAAYRVAPETLWELGAEVVAMGVEPDGFNINRDVGSTAPEALIRRVRELRADIGIALDGDADRVLIVDEKGRAVDGDQLMAVVARSWSEDGRLSQPGLVATIMSNLGLERFLAGIGLTLARTAVGDRYVLEYMREHGYNLGGEQSGHLVFLDHNTTGDGLITALQTLAILRRSGKALSELVADVERFPQVLVNVRVAEKRPLESLPALQAEVAKVEKALDGRGRVLIRYSGTEPKARVMVEGEDEARVREYAEQIAAQLQRSLGGEPGA